MKQLLILLALFVVAAVVFFFIQRPDAEIIKTPDTETPSETTGPNPASATYNIEGAPVTLSGGKSIENLNGFSEETSLMDVRGEGDINGDGRIDTVVTIGRFGGGSGFFIYTAALVSGPTSYKGSNAVFVGDRIIPQSISVDGSGVVTLRYLDRSPDEPFAAEPTVSTTKQFIYSGGQLQER